MFVSLALAFTAFRAGLALRRARQGRAAPGAPPRGVLLRRHLGRSKPAVVMLAIGFGAGPLATWALLDRAPFRTVHALLGGLALGLFVAAAVTGRRLEHGLGRDYDTHGAIALAALLAAAAAAVAGFVLLP
jgi:hypothetical protein